MVSGWTKKTTSLLRKWRAAAAVLVVVVAAVFVAGCVATEEAAPQRILLDTDMDTDDLLALLYILKQDRSEFDLKVR